MNDKDYIRALEIISGAQRSLINKLLQQISHMTNQANTLKGLSTTAPPAIREIIAGLCSTGWLNADNHVVALTELLDRAEQTTKPDDWVNRKWEVSHWSNSSVRNVVCWWKGGKNSYPEWTVRLDNLFKLWVGRATVSCWREFCGTAANSHDIKAEYLINTRGFGKVSANELLTTLRAVGLEPNWASEVEQHFGLL